MNVIFLFLLSSLGALVMAFYLPTLIFRVEQNILAQCQDIKKSMETASPVNPVTAIMLLNIAPTVYFFNPDMIYLPVFIFLLAIASYIDMVRRWVPDSLIFLLHGYTVYCMASGHMGKSPEEQIIAALLFMVPFVLINGYSRIKCGTFVFAAGDIYVALSMGCWLDKEYAVVIAAFSLLLALVYQTVFRKNNLPFIPFLLFSFLIYCMI